MCVRSFNNKHLLPAALLILLCPAVLCEETSTGWGDLASLRNAEAMRAFQSGSGPADKLGEAIALMADPTRDASTAVLIEALLNEARLDPEIAPNALYFLARWNQLHSPAPSPKKAEDFYRELIAEYPSTPYGQMAFVKLAILRLAGASKQDRESVFGGVEEWEGKVTDPAARRDFFLVLADTAARWEWPADKILPLLLAAHETGEIRGRMAATVLIRLGGLHEKLGHPGPSQEFYEAFLRLHPRDERAAMVRRIMEGQP